MEDQGQWAETEQSLAAGTSREDKISAFVNHLKPYNEIHRYVYFTFPRWDQQLIERYTVCKWALIMDQRVPCDDKEYNSRLSSQ